MVSGDMPIQGLVYYKEDPWEPPWVDLIDKRIDMDFGYAVRALKNGAKIQRVGWNGTEMFVIYQKGYPDGIPVNKQTADAYGVSEGTIMKFRPYMQLKTAQNDCAMWAPSGSDVLATDWEIIN